MFKDARELDRTTTAASFDQALARYAAQAEKWFDGSVNSIDRRLSFCDRLLHSVRATVARLSTSESLRYLSAAEDLQRDRRSLASLREDMLTGASGRADGSGLPGQRTAKRNTPSGGNLTGTDRRWVELESARFLAANHEVAADADELSIRAAHHAELKTSTFTPARSQAVTREFVAKVVDLGRQVPVPTTVKTAAVTAPADIDPQAMFL